MPCRAPDASSACVASGSRLRKWALAGAALACILGPSEPVSAQAIERPSDERLELPEFEPPAEVAPPVEVEPILPPLPPPTAPSDPFASGTGVFVKGYRIDGSTVFSADELARVVAPWSARRIRSEDLASVLNAITQLYFENGYVNSGALLPDDEDFEDRIVEIQIVEGSLSEIQVSGNRQFRDRALRNRIWPGATTPLQIQKLEQRIQILQQDPRIRKVEARLLPGDRRGEAILALRVEEASRFGADLRFNNYEPPSIGALAGQVETSVANLVGWGDAIRGQFTITEGLKRYRGRYELPFTRWGTRLSVDARYTDSKITESPFDSLDIENTFQSYQIGLWQPLYTSVKTEFEIGAVGDWRRSETTLGGTSFSFPDSGADDGETTASVLRFVADWLHRDRKQVIAARLQVSWGIDVLDATTHNGNQPDGEFVAGLLQLQWARRFGSLGVEAIVRGDLQIADDPLLSLEQIAVGGYATVRGYRENQRVQDQGVVASAEVRIPVWRQRRWGVVQLAPFADFGHVWNHHDRPESRRKTLASVGVGLRWALPRYLSARIYWGQNLTSVQTSGNLQDKGVQFQISCSWP